MPKWMPKSMSTGVVQASVSLDGTEFHAQTVGCDCCSEMTDLYLKDKDQARLALQHVDDAILDWEQAAHEAKLIRARLVKLYRLEV